jgi:hypothetical protein
MDFLLLGLGWLLLLCGRLLLTIERLVIAFCNLRLLLRWLLSVWV